MNPLFLKKLAAKKKRERDPNAPPPPTLLGQVKELRLTREETQRIILDLHVLKQRVEQLESKNRRLESYVETVRDWVNKLRK
jgi:hypothetical protein